MATPPLTAPPLGSPGPPTVTNLMPRTGSVLRTLLPSEGCGTNLAGLPSLHFPSLWDLALQVLTASLAL